MTESQETRLGRHVRDRRKALRIGQADLANRGGPSAATVRLIEKGEPVTLQRGTIAGLEKSLGWASGSIDRIRLGQSPRLADPEANPAPDGPAQDATETVVPVDDDVAVLGSLPPDALEGLSPADRAEVITAAKLSALQTAREIRRRLES